MSGTRTSSECQTGHDRYEIRVRGHLDDRWAAAFAGLALMREADGTTLLTGTVLDQAALHGLLSRVRDLGIPLVSVVHSGSGEPVPPETRGAEPADTEVGP